MSEKYARKIKKPDKEEAEKTFVGNCAGKIIFLSVRKHPCGILNVPLKSGQRHSIPFNFICLSQQLEPIWKKRSQKIPSLGTLQERFTSTASINFNLQSITRLNSEDLVILIGHWDIRETLFLILTQIIFQKFFQLSSSLDCSYLARFRDLL